MLHRVHFQQTSTHSEVITADRMPIGYAVRACGETHVNITGVVARAFPSHAIAVLWVLKHADRMLPQIRNYKLRRVK